MLPKDFTFDGAPSLYAIGLALQTKDPSLAGALQGFLGGTDSGALKGAAMVALGRFGGDDNLKFLRNAATNTQDAYADPAALGKALEDRLAAMNGLAAAQDASFLPRAMDMLQEAPPPASALARADYENLADWWQITLWRGAADCVAGICSQRSPLELTADSGLQAMLTDRLKELIDQPGPKRESLSRARQALRAAVIRAFGRVARLQRRRQQLRAQPAGHRPEPAADPRSAHQPDQVRRAGLRRHAPAGRPASRRRCA